MRSTNLIIFFSILAVILPNQGIISKESNSKKVSKPIELTMSKLIEKPVDGILIKGKPTIIKCKYGKAVSFNGSDQAIFLDSLQVKGLKQFTIEVLFQPASGGNFEQRYFHWGEVRGNRVLLELRASKTDWYFDAFIKSGDQQKTLIEPGLLHPLDQWYLLSYVIDNGKLETYVNGKKELESQIELAPFFGGKTSIGVRQNEQSWFKGAIYKIRISPKALKVEEFLKF